MKSYWTTAALLSLLLTVGCADRGEQKPATFEETKAAPGATGTTGDVPDRAKVPDTPVDRPPAVTPREDASAARRGTTAARRSTTRPAPSRTVTPAPRAIEYREVTVPEGTALPLDLMTPLSSETAQVETPVRARLKQAVVVDGVTALPAGSVFIGDVTDVERAGRVKGRARLTFTFNRVEAGNTSEDVKTNPIAFVAEATKGEDVTKIGAGAVGGAIVGGIVGGGEGAAKGAVIGGAAGTSVVLATRGKEVKLATGTDLAASLAEPLKIRVPVR